ncbi:hypothetical protein KM803_13070 [Clostridium tyrobutyricum]|uniref:hypothetical protein n=1 Tax=Clostridium tyrobutyricum TaxID=1519 RepID=UPI0010AAA22F|nr:hypothetical protein [Clostridium tyrobutyricum]MBV4432249.1 hypothetical protein [Clostridium tyrobutyricum]QCH27987.1 hypothetical protein EZN00_01588 [Clostridium tyrobutyricum]
MKIDFNKDKSMNIKLDKIPRLLYINEESRGCGQVYLNGKRVKALCETNIHAKTREDSEYPPLEYLIKYYDSKSHSHKTIDNGYNPIFTASINLKNTDLFKNLLNVLVKLLDDGRVPKKVKNDIKLQIENLTKRNEEVTNNE